MNTAEAMLTRHRRNGMDLTVKALTKTSHRLSKIFSTPAVYGITTAARHFNGNSLSPYFGTNRSGFCNIVNNSSARRVLSANTSSTSCNNVRAVRCVCSASSENQETIEKWKINVLYDSECPLCMHEIRWLSKRDKLGHAKFTDIASPGYNPNENGNVDYKTGMRTMHGVLPDGRVLSGMPVFRVLYDAVGLGWVWSVTLLPGMGWIADRAYTVWASWRMKITGREELEVIFRKRRQMIKESNKGTADTKLCNADECKL